MFLASIAPTRCLLSPEGFLWTQDVGEAPGWKPALPLASRDARLLHTSVFPRSNLETGQSPPTAGVEGRTRCGKEA